MSKPSVRRLIAVTASAVGLMGTLASPALAARVPYDPFYPLTSVVFDGPEQRVCDFPVRVTPLVNKVYIQDRPNGTQHTSGRLIFRLTNERTGKYVDRQVNGPVLINGDTTTLSGLSLINVFPGNDATPQRVTGARGYGLFITSGPSTFSGTRLVKIGHVKEDLCKTLA